MISVDRPDPPAEYLALAPTIQEQIDTLVANGDVVPSDLLDAHREIPGARDVLFSASHGKCMYCEGEPLGQGFGTIEHIFPKGQFPERALQWDNWGACCYWCNTHKGENIFSRDEPVVDPYSSDIESHLEFSGLDVRGRSQLGEWTIQQLQLATFAGLVATRHKRMNELQQLINIASGTDHTAQALRAQLGEWAAPHAPYSRSARAILVREGIIPN